MRVVVQRVSSSRVSVNGAVVGEIGRGLTLLVGIATTDTSTEIDWMVRKCLSLRLFANADSDRWEASIQDIQGEMLVISQFTLYGDCRKRRRPSFAMAAAPDIASARFTEFIDKLSASGLKIQTGTFGGHMHVDIQNDGPVTLLLERDVNV